MPASGKTPGARTKPGRTASNRAHTDRSRVVPHEEPRPEAATATWRTHPVAHFLLHPLFFALAAAVLVHLSALGTWFAQDDVSFIARARGLEPTPWSLARPLSEAVAWRGLVALFGVRALPMHAFTLALHLANVALVYAIGLRLLGGRRAAGAAAVLFGASAIAFTPLHWMSGLSELMATAFALAALLLFLMARDAAPGRATRFSLLAGVATLGALLSKETTLLLPLALFAARRRERPASAPRTEAGAWRTLGPSIVVATLYVVAFAVTFGVAPHLGGPAYAMTAAPGHLVRNAATYLEWIAMPGVPVRDLVAAVDPGALRLGLVVAVALVLLLWIERRDPRHATRTGVAWFALFLAPVLPLTAHTYLYYLYLPWAGLCWAIAAVGARLARRGNAMRWATAALVVAFVGLEFSGAHQRESRMSGTFPLDKTMRESTMLRNAVADLRRVHVAPGDSIAFINPAPRRMHLTLARLENADSASVKSYIPLEGAMRGGETIRVFFPGVTYLGFAPDLPPAWDRARVFLYQDEGTLRDLGRGAAALTEQGLFALRLRDWPLAERSFEGGFALGDTLPDAAYGMIATAYFLGRRDEAMRWAAFFLARWPDDPRANELALRLGQERTLGAAPPDSAAPGTSR